MSVEKKIRLASSFVAMLKDQLDFDYLRKWAKKLNTLGVLEEMISLVS